MERATTLKEIAYELNLSINTVSRALRDCDDISRETKKLVIDTAISLGYMPKSINQFARKDNDSLLIAVLTGESKNIYFLLTVNKICSCLIQNYQYSTTTINCHTSVVGSDIIKQCISQRIDGIISLLSVDDDALQVCKFNNIPIVCVGRMDMKDKTDCVHLDVDGGTKLWANYLVNFHKDNKIIYVGLDDTMSEDDIRYQLFVKNLNSLRENATVPRYGYSDPAIFDVIQSSNGNVSVVCFSDEILYALMDKLNEKIPNIRRLFPHFHIIGFDSLSTHLSGLIDVTSIDYDYDELANQAVVALSNKFTNKNEDTKFTVLPVGLHTRRII